MKDTGFDLDQSEVNSDGIAAVYTDITGEEIRVTETWDDYNSSVDGETVNLELRLDSDYESEDSLEERVAKELSALDQSEYATVGTFYADDIDENGVEFRATTEDRKALKEFTESTDIYFN